MKKYLSLILILILWASSANATQRQVWSGSCRKPTGSSYCSCTGHMVWSGTSMPPAGIQYTGSCWNNAHTVVTYSFGYDMNSPNVNFDNVAPECDTDLYPGGPPLSVHCVKDLVCPAFLKITCDNGMTYWYGDPSSCFDGPEPGSGSFDPDEDTYIGDGWSMTPGDQSQDPFDADGDGLNDFIDPFPYDSTPFEYSIHFVGYDANGDVCYLGIYTSTGAQMFYGNHDDVVSTEPIVTIDFPSENLPNHVGPSKKDVNFTPPERSTGGGSGGGTGGGGGGSGGGADNAHGGGDSGSGSGGGSGSGSGSTPGSSTTSPNLSGGSSGSDLDTVNDNLQDVMANQQHLADIETQALNGINQLVSDSATGLENQIITNEKLQNISENQNTTADNTNSIVHNTGVISDQLVGMEGNIITLRDFNVHGFSAVVSKLNDIENALQNDEGGSYDFGDEGYESATPLGTDSLQFASENNGDNSYGEYIDNVASGIGQKFQDRNNQFISTIQDSPIFSLPFQIFSGFPSHGTSIKTVNIGAWGSGSSQSIDFDYAQYASLWDVLKSVLYVLTVFACFKIIVVKGANA